MLSKPKKISRLILFELKKFSQLILSKPKKISRLMLFKFKKFSHLISSEFKKFSWPTIVLIYVFGILLTVYTLRPLFWTAGTGISDTLDTIFWGDIKQSEPVVSKTVEKVEKDKQGKTFKTIETIKYDDGKTVWDWLSLLGVPLSLAILGYVLQEQQRKRADNETKEEVLQTYFDRLSVLLIDRNLIALSNKSQSSTITHEEQELLDSSLDVIRARTLSILRRFENDAERKTSVIKFLIETDIIGKLKLNLSGADLSGAELRFANLQGADLRFADLSGAELRFANLQGAYLRSAKLQGAYLNEAFLQGADLTFANLQGAKLQGAKLQGAKLQGAYLQGAYLQGADLRDIEWDSKTVSPGKRSFANAKNIPEELKKELGITP
jgi:uncharacterized protein YjbI with pentapeptide repeats